MVRFRIQPLLADKNWSTRSNIPKIDRISDSSTDRTLIRLNVFVESCGNELICGQIDTPHADMSFSIFTITHFVFQMDIIYCFKNLFESIPDYRKIVLLMFSIENDYDLLPECEKLKNDINRLCLEFQNILMEQNEDYLAYIKDQEEAIFERMLNK